MRTYAGVGAGDERHAAAEVTAVQHLERRAAGVEPLPEALLAALLVLDGERQSRVRERRLLVLVVYVDDLAARRWGGWV